MTPKINDAKKGRGRPSEFDRTTALQRAMTLFWERGYEGTSFDDLTRAMGISASSFYNSFGCKEQLYKEATQAFVEASDAWFSGVLNDEALDTKSAFGRLFETAAREFTRNDHPAGCMISLACTQVAPSLATIRDMMVEHRAESEAVFAERLRKGVAAGDIPADTDIDSLAAYFSALIRGLAVQARDGASRKKLLNIARVAMRVWPTKPRPPKKAKRNKP